MKASCTPAPFQRPSGKAGSPGLALTLLTEHPHPVSCAGAFLCFRLQGSEQLRALRRLSLSGLDVESPNWKAWKRGSEAKLGVLMGSPFACGWMCLPYEIRSDPIMAVVEYGERSVQPEVRQGSPPMCGGEKRKSRFLILLIGTPFLLPPGSCTVRTALTKNVPTLQKKRSGTFGGPSLP